MLKIIFDNFVMAVFGAFFAAILTLVVSGEHVGNALFTFNTIILWVVFLIVDFVKGKHKKEIV